MTGAARAARLILASASPRRLALLRQVGIEPDEVRAPDVSEIPGKAELPPHVARRLAREKAAAASRPEDDAYLLAADTVVAVGRRILPKAETPEQAEACLRLLSGRGHRVYTAVCLLTPAGRMRERLVETRLRFKRLSASEIAAYLASREWAGKAGGYAIQGLAGGFVLALVGSYGTAPLRDPVAPGGGGFPGPALLARRAVKPLPPARACPTLAP